MIAGQMLKDHTCATSGTRSNKDDLLLRFPVTDCLMKYFCAWLATCVGDLDCTYCLDMPRQSPCKVLQIVIQDLMKR